MTDNSVPMKVIDVELTVDRLDHTDSIMFMGALCARALREQGQITLFVTKEMRVEQALPYEVELDTATESSALRFLMNRGYTDEELRAFLKGRDDRKRRRELLDKQKEGV
jgi:hypothetical protein